MVSDLEVATLPTVAPIFDISGLAQHVEKFAADLPIRTSTLECMGEVFVDP